MTEVKIDARPWTPQDLLDDLQSMIDEQSDNYMNTDRTTLCMAKAYLAEHFKEPRWIPVAEELPKMFGSFLITVQEPNGRRYSDYADFDPFSKRFTTALFLGKRSTITHWKPMPKPAREDE
jgi:hypothetical protein